MFYSDEEFEAQVQWLVDLGWDEAEAMAEVRQQEIADELEYNTYRDELKDEPRADDFINDSWYETQYELDTDYI
jgi:hypothetical protein